MPRFLIEVPHEEGTLDCARAVALFLRTGSHYLTHADWGCMDGDHRSWLIVEEGSREEARMIVPADYRARARVVQLNSFDLAEIEHALRQHDR